MPNLLPASAQKVQDAFNAQAVESKVIEMASTTRIAAEAAAALGCAVAQIAKSLVFRTHPPRAFILPLAGGTNRVDENGCDFQKAASGLTTMLRPLSER